jgi:hypothetical protein
MIVIAPFLIVIAIAAIMIKIMKRTGNRKEKYFYNNRVWWIFCGYAVILLICLVLDTVHPVKQSADIKMVHSLKLEKESTELFNAAIEGRIDKVDPENIGKTWDLDYHRRQLDITFDNSQNFNSQIVVEKKKTNDDKIEVVFYRTESSMNGMNVTELKKPPHIELEGNRLTLMNPKKRKIEFSQFKNVFTVNQFIGDKMFSHDTDFFEGQSILYLRIPKDLELTDKSNLNFQFVE